MQLSIVISVNGARHAGTSGHGDSSLPGHDRSILGDSYGDTGEGYVEGHPKYILERETLGNNLPEHTAVLENKDLDTGYSILLEEKPPSAASMDDDGEPAATSNTMPPLLLNHPIQAHPPPPKWPLWASQAAGPHGAISQHWARNLARDLKGKVGVRGEIAKFLARVHGQALRLWTKLLIKIEENRNPILCIIAILWMAASVSLLSSSKNQVSIYTPERQLGAERFVQSVTQFCTEVVLERLSALFIRWNYSSVFIKIPAVLISALPIITLFGFMYRNITGCTWPQALLKMHAIVNRQPGANMVSEQSLKAFLVINAAYFAGLFTFAVFLGLVSDEVKRSFRSIREGNYPVRLVGHTLILNWSADAVPLLRQLALGKKYSEEAFFQKPVVVLSENEKYLIDEEISKRMKEPLEIYTRTGNPANPMDLDIVGAKHADTVVVLHPQSKSSWHAAEASKAATAMALGITGSTRCQNVIFQVVSSMKPEIDCLKSLTDGQSLSQSGSASGSSGNGPSRQVLNLSSMPDRNFMDGFTCHASVQPGILRVWMKILQHGPSSAKLRVLALPSWCQSGGHSFRDVRRSFLDCVVIGFLRAEQINLSPDDSQMLQHGDKLVVLSYVKDPKSRPGTQGLFQVAGEAAALRLDKPNSFNIAPRKIIVAGWKRSRLQDMIKSFADATPENSHVTFIVRHLPEEPSPPSRWGTCKFSYVQSEHPTSMKALNDAGIKTADTVVLTGLADETLPSVEADAIVLSSILQVQSAVSASGRATAPHVIAKVQRMYTQQVLHNYFSGSKGYDMMRLSEQPTAVLEKERLEREAAEREKAEKERLDKEHLEKSRREREREHKKHLEEERHEKERHDGMERERLDKERSAAKTPDKERSAAKTTDKERSAAKTTASPAVGPQINLPTMNNNCPSSSSPPQQPSAVEIVHAVELSKTSAPTTLFPKESAAPSIGSSTKKEPVAAQKPLLSSPWTGSSTPVSTPSPAPLKKPAGPPRITNPEVFTADDISAALLVQVAAQPDVTAVIRRMLSTRDEVELFLRNPAALNIAAGDTVAFAEVIEAARRLKQTALGFVTAHGCIVMVPDASSCHKFEEGDQIVVLAQDYQPRKK
ncbi:hypothetical protein CEUSTIGMA_g10776.t1 [Chlamydomonas eustigma]|uniref:CASTOR/POLLUX/SYM8 ion channel conserved domain-containing protein n=1 Tax=Chlamydomonas eustigma TaxID=1157962 RepID=A0A250XJT7_9CHLO|nr:hypothetical protein CEUSTIGMA_g10776.t1 [Chlamydomonas eustigma]|eukprot:GAX83351.1 hypothetical protein CEUSTIGMA_g10776.t1 [Chlamydomonas eustigma]